MNPALAMTDHLELPFEYVLLSNGVHILLLRNAPPWHRSCTATLEWTIMPDSNKLSA